MANTLANIVSYFHDCYRSDNRDLFIYDFLDRKVEDKMFFEGREELVTGEHPIIPINSEKAIRIEKKLEVFQKEKELLFGAFFICGHYIDFRGETKRLCSPLFYYPAEIEHKEEYHYLSIKQEERRINHPLIQWLSKDSESDILHDPLFKQLPKGFIEFGHIGTLVSLCKKYFTGVDFENVYSYPDNFTIKSLKQKWASLDKENISNTLLIPSSMLGIVSKSTNTRGVLNELSHLASSNNFSEPLRSLLTDERIPTNENVYQKCELPMVLSEAQQAILKSSSIHPLTLIVGPPGTGKSYTIGAIAIEHMSRGESVLIASRTHEAVDVIVAKITDQIGINKCVVRGGKKRAYKTPLSRYLKALITRVNPMRYLLKEFAMDPKLNLQKIEKSLSDLNHSISSLRNKITQLEQSFEDEVENEVTWGKHLGASKSGMFNQLKTYYLEVRNNFQKPLWEYSKELRLADESQMRMVLQVIKLKYIYQVVKTIHHQWQDLKNFHEALKLSSDTEKMKSFEDIDFKVVLKAFPIWLTNLSEVKDVLPFRKEMFDVVIIDEATQCDIASCLPLMQRAKRVVFAGDPNQLRHVSFLSRGIQNLYKTKYQLNGIPDSKLNYRDKSVLDVAMGALQSGTQVAMLDEHYRSIAPIIAFSNSHFYDNDLRVMTERPDETERGVYLIQCNGVRGKNGTNSKEAEKLLEDVKKCILMEKELRPGLCSTIGILSPFRAQVDLLAKMVLDNLQIEDIEKHHIRVGTAYSFQGEERDVMYLSFALDAQSHHSAFIHINKPDVFNVAITRARKQQLVYVSVTKKEVKGDSLLRSYLANPTKAIIQKYENSPAHDSFLEEVKVVLDNWGMNAHWSNFSIAGLHIDLLLKYEGRYIGIDLVGYPGELEDVFGVERYRILNRAGVQIFPLPFSDWYFENEATKAVLKQVIGLKLPSFKG